LKDAVDTVKGAAHANVEDVVLTAEILAGGWAGLKETASMTAEDKVLLTLMQRVARDSRDMGLLPRAQDLGL
jgi:hypothetical protein